MDNNWLGHFTLWVGETVGVMFVAFVLSQVFPSLVVVPLVGLASGGLLFREMSRMIRNPAVNPNAQPTQPSEETSIEREDWV